MVVDLSMILFIAGWCVGLVGYVAFLERIRP
jgi:hypothetical protein